jgi:hypothetical protein
VAAGRPGAGEPIDTTILLSGSRTAIRLGDRALGTTLAGSWHPCAMRHRPSAVPSVGSAAPGPSEGSPVTARSLRAGAALLLGAGLLVASGRVSWAWSDCDDGCSTDRTGAVATRIPDLYGSLVLITALVAALAAVAVLGMALRGRPRPWLARLVAMLAVFGAAGIAIALFYAPAGLDGDPFLRPRAGWYLDLAAAAALVAASIGLRERPGEPPTG